MSSATSSLARSSCRLCRPSSSARQAIAGGAQRHQSTAASTSASTLDTPLPANARAASTVAATPSEETQSSSSSSSKTRVVAGILLSRAPLKAHPLSSFEREYYRYARKINRAIGGQFDPEWFFRKGSQGYEGWKELSAAAEASKEVLEEEASPSSESQDKDLHSLSRLPSRTLYLLAEKSRKAHAWQFPQGGVEGAGKTESLVEAAERELKEEFGEELDVWMTGHVPAAWLGYTLPQGEQRDGCSETKVFFMPARVLRGSPKPNKEEGLKDYAWLTREEIMEKVGGEDSDLWKAVRDVLSQ